MTKTIHYQLLQKIVYKVKINRLLIKSIKKKFVLYKYSKGNVKPAYLNYASLDTQLVNFTHLLIGSLVIC